jgi:hypothetical protein
MLAIYIYLENYWSLLPGKNKHNSVAYIFSWFTEKREKKEKDVALSARELCLLTRHSLY